MANLSISINWKKNITFVWLLFVLLEDWKDWKVSGGISIGSDLPNDDNPTTAVPVVLRNNDFRVHQNNPLLFTFFLYMSTSQKCAFDGGYKCNRLIKWRENF